MKRLKTVLFFWGPVFLWMGAIFIFSSRPRFGITEEFFFDFLIFKTLHMIEYALLYFLLFRAFYHSSKYSIAKQLVVALIFSVLYAVGDEVHQAFVPTREGKIRDILIDSTGILIMYWYIKTNINFVIKKIL